jgi:hypothetical protein
MAFESVPEIMKLAVRNPGLFQRRLEGPVHFIDNLLIIGEHGFRCQALFLEDPLQNRF